MALGLVLVGSARVSQCHARIECDRKGSNDKIAGEGHPPHGAAMVRSRWHNSCIVVTTFLRTKLEFIGARPLSYWIKSLEISWWRAEIQ